MIACTEKVAVGHHHRPLVAVVGLRGDDLLHGRDSDLPSTPLRLDGGLDAVPGENEVGAVVAVHEGAHLIAALSGFLQNGKREDVRHHPFRLVVE